MSSAAVQPRLSPWLSALALAGLFGVLLFFFTRHNGFPVYYHLDEPGKGEQILFGQYNYHHPLLLLDTAGLLLRASGLPRTLENAVLCGRWASAIFTALAVVLLALLAGRRAGWPAAAACALLIPAQPLVYELAHYCKEDPALLFGISLALLALDLFQRQPDWRRAAFLGASCGVATSGKYVGVITLLLALPFVFRPAGGRFLRGTAFFGALLTVLVVLNLPYFLHPEALFSGLRYEAREIETGGGQGISRKIPHAFYLEVFLDNFTWPLLLGLLLFAGRLFTARPGRALEVLLLALPLGYVVLLSFVPKTSPRYFLAVSPLLVTAACIGFMSVAAWLPARLARLRPWLPAGLATFALILQGQLTLATVRGFRTNSRQEMTAWIAQHLPEKTLLLAESRLYLSRDETWPEKRRPDLIVEELAFAADAGTLAELKARGIRHIAVFRSNFSKLMADDTFKPADGRQSQYQRRKDFYRDLLAQGKLLKKTGQGEVTTLNPRLMLYQLP